MRTFCAPFLIAAAVFALRVGAIIPDKGYGEPYAVGGKRIVFTTWYWVRPRQMDWQDDQGKVWLTYNSGDYLMSYVYPRHGLAMSGQNANAIDQVLASFAEEATR